MCGDLYPSSHERDVILAAIHAWCGPPDTAPSWNFYWTTAFLPPQWLAHMVKYCNQWLFGSTDCAAKRERKTTEGEVELFLWYIPQNMFS